MGIGSAPNLGQGHGPLLVGPMTVDWGEIQSLGNQAFLVTTANIPGGILASDLIMYPVYASGQFVPDLLQVSCRATNPPGAGINFIARNISGAAFDPDPLVLFAVVWRF